ncbi:MAG: copper amine oxidase [Ilumatobacteraceae bacterium]
MKFAAVLTAAGLAVTACGDDGNDAVATTPSSAASTTPETTSPMTEPSTTEMPGSSMPATSMPATSMPEMQPTTDDGASTLRADLTSLLQEHVYLAGITVETAVDAAGNMDDPTVQAAAAALDENTVALSEAVGSVAGDEQGAAFLQLWRDHIGFFVDYTLGKASGDQAKVDQALQDLAGYEQTAGAFFEDVTGGAIKSADLVMGLDGHVATLTAAIDAVVAGQPDAFAQLREAAQHMFGAALFLSTGISQAAPEMFPGDVTSTPAETRAMLTNLLQEHVYLAGIAIEQAVEAGGDMQDPTVQAAVATLDTNSVALSDLVASVAGDEQGAAFLDLWRTHIGFFVDYTLGKATSDDAMVQQALSDLDGYRQTAGAFFEDITAGAIHAEDVEASLDEHVATLTAAIDDVVAGDSSAFHDLRIAAQHMPMAALALSTGIVAATT